MCTHVYHLCVSCPQRWEEGIRVPGVGIADGHEPSNIHARNPSQRYRTPVPCKHQFNHLTHLHKPICPHGTLLTVCPSLVHETQYNSPVCQSKHPLYPTHAIYVLSPHTSRSSHLEHTYIFIYSSICQPPQQTSTHTCLPCYSHLTNVLLCT